MNTMSLHRQAGLSLVEMMIAMTIGLFLLVGLSGIFVNSSRTQNELTKTARQIEDGRFGISIIADDVALAGYYGYFYSPATPSALVDPCELTTMATIRTGLQLPIQGYDSPTSTPLSCINSANFLAGTDVLVVRRADSKVTATGSLVANQVYLQANSDTSSSANPIINTGTATNFTLLLKDNLTAAPIRKFHVHTYFISPCSVGDGTGGVCTSTSDGGKPIPTLKRLELTVDSGGSRVIETVPLVEGVENMQIDYGVDTTNDGTQESWLTTPAAVADWANVMAVRVTLLVRNVESTPGYTDPKTYNLGAAGNVTPGGSYKRHVYQTAIRLVNPSSRRETP
jgi:type IV pilus assembly protein PilW